MKLLNLVLGATIATPFVFLLYVITSIYSKEPQHEDAKPNSNWVELELKTVSGDIVYLSCPQRDGAVAGGHSNDCYVKLRGK